MRKFVLFIPILCVILSSCATGEMGQVAAGRFVSDENRYENLFAEDQLEMGNIPFNELFKVDTSLPRESSVALVGIIQSDSTDSAGNASDVLRGAAADLESAPEVDSVSIVPYWVMPDVVNLSSLRTIAARYQADLVYLVLIKTNSRTSNSLFGKDETIAEARCDGLLLHSRTGIVLHSSLKETKAASKRNSLDRDSIDLAKRTERIASIEASSEVLSGVKSYLAASR